MSFHFFKSSCRKAVLEKVNIFQEGLALIHATIEQKKLIVDDAYFPVENYISGNCFYKVNSIGMAT